MLTPTYVHHTQTTHIFKWKGSKCVGGLSRDAAVDFVLRQHAGWMMKSFFSASLFLTISFTDFDRRSALRQFMAANKLQPQTGSDTRVYSGYRLVFLTLRPALWGH